MAIATRCCLNLPPPPPSASPNFTHQFTCRQLKSEKWKNKCVVGMASCLIIGLEIHNFTVQENLAMATQNIFVLESKEISNGQRWSDQRSCPSWRLNSLETIVPENLPRPSARRGWELVRRSKNIPAPLPAPAVKFTVRSIDDCFTV